MSIGEVFRHDPEAEKKGQWLDYGTFRVRIRRPNSRNKQFAKLNEKLLKPVQTAAAVGGLPEHKTRALLGELYARTIVTDWDGGLDENGVQQPFVDSEGVCGEKGAELSYSPERCMAMFKEYPDFLVDLIDKSKDATIWRKLELEEEAKN